MQTIGERLEEARKKKGITIREAAEATKIRGDYLTKFEGNQFNIGLTDLYVRGFLRNYALYLHLPADRIVNDFAALGHAESRPRQPSREVYGRMDLSVSGGEDRDERRGGGGAAPAHAEAAGGAEGDANPARTLRPHASGLPTPRLDPALIHKGLYVLAGVVMLVAVIWFMKAVFGGSSKTVEHPGLASSGAATNAPAAQAAAADSDATVTLIAKNPVNLQVVRISDNAELYNGQLAANQRLACPNVGLRVTASAIESVTIEFHGAHYQWGKATGRQTVTLPVQH